MHTFLWILIFLGVFAIMEFMAWWTHKFVMHGFLWRLHKDHHKKDHTHWLERNDAFFLIYAAVSMLCFYLWNYNDLWYCLPIALGIMAYGAAYFMVHDIFIHRRLKWFGKTDHWYAKGIRRAHKMHHKHSGREKGECFGMLVVPFKYFKN